MAGVGAGGWAGCCAEMVAVARTSPINSSRFRVMTMGFPPVRTRPAYWTIWKASTGTTFAETIIPLLSRGGEAAPSIECCEATVDGADGVVLVNEISGCWTNHPVRANIRCLRNIL